MNKWRPFFLFFALTTTIFSKEKSESDGLIPMPQLAIPPENYQTKNLGTSITSDKLEISLNEDQSEFTFKGNVKLLASSFSAECSSAKVVTFGKTMNLASGLDSIRQISITGPLVLRQGERSCGADRAEITTTDKTIILLGNATVKDTMGTISGSEIRINYATKCIEISGTSPSDPVALNVATSPTPEIAPKVN